MHSSLRLHAAIINRIMAWKYCNGDFSQRDKGQRPRGSSRTLNVYIQRHMRDRSRMYTRRRRVSVSPRENVDWNYVKRRYSTLCVGARVYRFAFESRRLKGYKRTDPCVSPLFPLIFPLENPQSVRSAFLSFPLSR